MEQGREVHVEWAEPTESFGGAGSGRGEKYPNVSCDFIKKKKRSREGVSCPQRGPAAGRKGAAHEHPVCGCLERRGVCLPERVLSQGRALEQETVASC